MAEDRYLGVDGCKAGWFFVSIGPGEDSEFGIFESIERLFNAYSNAKSILIDIPIGLPFEAKKSRTCDKEARNALKPKRHNSVFLPPCRDALNANNYSEASQINKGILGKGISQQTYHISYKIKEVDDFLNRYPEAKNILRETHPEICFWALAGSKPMAHYKKTPKGLSERLDLLKQHFPSSSAIYKAALDRYFRKEVGRDDILDALAAAVTATQLNEHEATLPEYAEKDSLGLPMEIVYPKVNLQSSPRKTNEADEIQGLIFGLISKCDSDSRVFPATEFYNETWMLRLTLEWLSRNKIKNHPYPFLKIAAGFQRA